MPKVRWAYDAALDGHTFEASRVEITLNNGQSFNARCDVALGHPDNAMSSEQRINKFMDCAAAALTPVAKPQAMQIVDAATRLEQLDSIVPLMRLLA
jgi:2-methylcitrate dehydratase PrpD